MNRKRAAAGLAWGASVAQCRTRRWAILGGNIIREKPVMVKSRSDPILLQANAFALPCDGLFFMTNCSLRAKLKGKSITWIDRAEKDCRLCYQLYCSAFHSQMDAHSSYQQTAGPVPLNVTANNHGNVSEAERVDCNQWLIISLSLLLYLSPGVTWSFLT